MEKRSKWDRGGGAEAEEGRQVEERRRSGAERRAEGCVADWTCSAAESEVLPGAAGTSAEDHPGWWRPLPFWS